jgi:ribonuclease HI
MDIPWAYFDGASQGNPPVGGLGGILYLSSNHNIAFKAGIGQETNNYCELMALKLTLQLAQEYGVTQLQIFGDSLLVIQWI